MDIKIITLEPGAGPVIISIDATRYPQSVAGIIWRYSKEKLPEGKAGIFNSDLQDIPVGIPADIHEKYFLVRGIVIHQNDNPPTPYQVSIEIKQGTKTVLFEVPPDWSGQLSNKDIALVYKLQFVVKDTIV